MFRLSNEDAIFRSFRDIDELINDMLELKARNAAVETQLKEMHDRYSQLVEVEGKRQKLKMTLKNIRHPRSAKLINLLLGGLLLAATVKQHSF